MILAAGAVVAIGVAVLVAVLLAGGGPSPVPSLVVPSPTASSSPTKSQPPPRARFEVTRLASVSGSRHPRHKKIRERARNVASRCSRVIASVYTFGFLDRRGPASRLLDLFVGAARRQARTHPQVVTIGSAARRLRGLRQQHSTLRIRTLFSQTNHPITALAVAQFRARGRLRGGGRLLVRSRGTFFLRPGKHGWLISGFEIRRKDRTRKG